MSFSNSGNECCNVIHQQGMVLHYNHTSDQTKHDCHNIIDKLVSHSSDTYSYALRKGRGTSLTLRLVCSVQKWYRVPVEINLYH